ncbi:DUF6220 domain-containing protein [Paenibacillus sp. XY044]|uniref:DUF6220 domain-containing protein n=1 Tax=Paenibacillus sp. XY044 TaxID=2026089 RepID=UPI0015C624A3|nr:DUF6220 domain-containing protein [Paenibacillus sp. XY044]
MMVNRSYSRIARICFMTLAWLFTISVALQVLLAGLALFVSPDNWPIHENFPRYFSLLPLIMVVLAWIGRLPGKLIRRSLGLLGMTIGIILTAVLSSRIGVLSALHPVIAIMLFWSCTLILRSVILYRIWKL